MLDTKKVTLFYNLQIRDTISHYPGYMLELRKAKAWSFEIQNKLNQSVQCFLIGGDAQGDIGSNVTISAGSTQPIVTNIWSNKLGIRLICSTAPTSGFVTLTGEYQEES